jgi:predicted dehydrogenase
VPAGANRIVVYGEGRALTADWNEGQVPEIVLHVPGKHERLEADMPDTTPAAALVETVLDNAPNLSPGRDSGYEVALVEAAYRSAATRRVVKVNLKSS